MTNTSDFSDDLTLTKGWSKVQISNNSGLQRRPGAAAAKQPGAHQCELIACNSFVPLEPINQLQVDLADMKAFGGKPHPFVLVAVDALTKKVASSSCWQRKNA